MKDFFKVTNLDTVFTYQSEFACVETESISLENAGGRILAVDVVSDIDIPPFSRSTMDGYAVSASSTFGASEGNPAYLEVKGSVIMGTPPSFSITRGEAARISTGGMLPDGADSVVMIEHSESIDDHTIEVYRSVAPGQHMIEAGEDVKKGNVILNQGRKLRPQEIGLLAAIGKESVSVYKQPVIGIISTGDEIVPVNVVPEPGRIRDINSYSLADMVLETGGVPVTFGIVPDNLNALLEKCTSALNQTDMVLISGGSSVGKHDFTIDVLSSLPEANILVHGISISPGKPTILAKAGQKAVWGLPGHVTSAMVVMAIVVRPFIEHISGLRVEQKRLSGVSAILNRNISSAQGRIDYVRVRLIEKDGRLQAEPILGKSGLLNTMVKADGLIEIGLNNEGLDRGTTVDVIPL